MNHAILHFAQATLIDMRCGRQSWRVLLTFTAPAFVLSLLIGLA